MQFYELLKLLFYKLKDIDKFSTIFFQISL